MNNNRYYSNKKTVRKNRLLKTTLGITLAAVLMVQGVGSSMHPAFVWAADTIQTAEKQEKTGKLNEVYLNGTLYKPDKTAKEGDGTVPEKAVWSLQKAASLVKENGTIYVEGPVSISSEVSLTIPAGVKVKAGKALKGPMIKITGKGRLTMNLELFAAKDVDLTKADLGKDALVIRKAQPEEGKDVKPAEKPEETGKDPETSVPAEKPEEKPAPALKEKASAPVVPESMSMEKPAALETLSMNGGFTGNGRFVFEKADLIPDQYETVCSILFYPADTDRYDYTEVPGWNAETKCVTLSTKVYVESLKAPVKQEEEQKPEEQKPAEQKPEEQKPADQKPADKDHTDQNITVPEKEEKPETEKDPLFHEQTGIRMTGSFIPDKVELRVSQKENTKVLAAFGVEEILKAYEIKLWDTEADCEYKIPKGEKAKVMIPVPEGAEQYEELVVEHYIKESDTFEYFKAGENLQIKDGFLIFETSSLSPFNVGGNQLVGIGTDSPNHSVPDQAARPAKPSKPADQSRPSQKTENSISGNKEGTGSNVNRPTNGTTVKPSSNTGNKTVYHNPHTGDESNGFLYIVIALLAVVVILVILVFGRRKKK